MFEPKYEDTNVYFWIYDFNSEKFQSAGEFNVKGLPDLYYLATMKDKVAILTNIDDDMIRNSIFMQFSGGMYVRYILYNNNTI